MHATYVAALNHPNHLFHPIQVISNGNGELCAHYPIKIVILESTLDNVQERSVNYTNR